LITRITFGEDHRKINTFANTSIMIFWLKCKFLNILHTCECWGNTNSNMNDGRSGRPENVCSIRLYILPHFVQTGSDVHPAYYTMCKGEGRPVTSHCNHRGARIGWVVKIRPWYFIPRNMLW
jgi:hypothetical protein